ncbi:MAG TPA: acyl-CoA dehydrogenase [Pseudomonadales bacterium]|nr:acyl-CoA dehydrogenase [Pseudomonadales bacterium]
MALAFNEEQRALKDTARDFARNQSPVESFRQLRDSKHTDGFSADIWQAMIELGWSGMIFPEAYGGFEFGYMGLAGCFEEFGHTLVSSPLLSSVVLAGSVLLFGGSEEQKSTLLPQVVGGEKRLALAIDEGFHHNPANIACTAKREGSTFILNGIKSRVIDGGSADLFIVAARTSGKAGDTQGISLFLVDASAEGLGKENVSLVDSRNYAKLTFDNVCIPASHLVGELDNGFTALDKALDRARICLTAEMFGGMQEIFERTTQYLKERKQFGVLIGTFQALQHRAAHMYTEIEMCKSILMLALDAVEKDADNAAQLVSAAKAKISDTYELVSNEATQMHGGIGVTDELDIGLFLKRARVSAELLGSSRFHYDRYARLEGF